MFANQFEIIKAEVICNFSAWGKVSYVLPWLALAFRTHPPRALDKTRFWNPRRKKRGLMESVKIGLWKVSRLSWAGDVKSKEVSKTRNGQREKRNLEQGSGNERTAVTRLIIPQITSMFLLHGAESDWNSDKQSMKWHLGRKSISYLEKIHLIWQGGRGGGE